MESTDKSHLYSFMFDEFASELGSTLDDLATNWEENNLQNDSEFSDSISSTSRTSSVISSQSSDHRNMDDLPKKLAKPLHFHNPVFYMFYKGPSKAQIPTRTLIPIKQPDVESKNHTVGKYIKKGKKNPTGKILSKITAVSRRHSQPKISVAEEVYANDDTIIEEEDSFVPVIAEVAPERNPGGENPNKISETVQNLPKPSPRKRVLPATTSKEKSPPEKNPQNNFQSPQKPSPTSSKDLHGSPASSSPSDEDLSSNEMTMADVIHEYVSGPPDTESKENVDCCVDQQTFVEQPGQLRRDKTLKWSGTRKAPALIREFTRKQKRTQKLSGNTEISSPNKEVEAVMRLQPDQTTEIERPRSCTPSRQISSFGMSDTSDNTDETLSDGLSSPIDSSNESKFSEPVSPSKTNNKAKRESAFIILSSLLPPAPRLRRSHSSKVRAFLQKMGNNVNSALGYAVTQFVEQTLKNKERRPLVLLHDIRSFLTDIKRYLISNPHLGLKKKIQKIVNFNSAVDVEGAVDDALDRLVLYPLHNHIYRCLVIDYTKSGKLKNLEEAMACAKLKTKSELGIREDLIPPDEGSIEEIKGHFINLQKTYSPYFKLKELLAAVMKIYESTQDLSINGHSAKKIGADDFLPLLVYSIVKCEFVAADIEAQYIDGLLDPNLLLGEGGYYLTTLISAIQVVFSIKRREVALPNISDLQGFLKVGISSQPKSPTGDNDDVVLHKTLHVPPAMNCKSLCGMISRKFNIAKPKEYCLHVVINGNAHPLAPGECPQLVKMDLLTQFPSSSFFFSFQKIKEETGDEDTGSLGENGGVIQQNIDKNGGSTQQKENGGVIQQNVDKNGGNTQQEENGDKNVVVIQQNVDKNGGNVGVIQQNVDKIGGNSQQEENVDKNGDVIQQQENGDKNTQNSKSNLLNEEQGNSQKEIDENVAIQPTDEQISSANDQKSETTDLNQSHLGFGHPKSISNYQDKESSVENDTVTDNDTSKHPELTEGNKEIYPADKENILEHQNKAREDSDFFTKDVKKSAENDEENGGNEEEIEKIDRNLEQNLMNLHLCDLDKLTIPTQSPCPIPSDPNLQSDSEIPKIVVQPVMTTSPKGSPRHTKLASIDENYSSDDQVFTQSRGKKSEGVKKRRPKSDTKIEIPGIFVKKSAESDPGMPEKNLSVHSSTEDVFCKISSKRVSRYGKESVASLTEYFETQ